jgi:uncharacterized protein
MGRPLAAKTNRLIHLDVLRGLAVLGLLFARFPAKGGSPLALEHPDVLGWSLGEQVVWWLNSVFVDDAMRGLFALLFGVSLWMMTGPREDRALVPVWSSYLVRTAGLFVFGLVFHVILLAEASDILHVYALAAVVALAVSRLDPRLIVLGGVAGFLLLAGHDALGDISTAPVTAQAMEQARLERATGYLPHVLQSIENFRAWSLNTGIIWKCLEAGSYMLLGLGLFRLGFFTGGTAGALTLTAAGFYAIGIALCGGVALTIAAGGFEQLVRAHFITTLGKPLIVLAHAARIMALMRSRSVGGVLTAVLAPVGRMALTLYLAGSAMMLFLFTGAGLDLGPFDRYGVTGMAVVCSIVLILTARIWLGLVRQGPFEWALKTWTQILSGPVQALATRLVPAGRLQNA